MNVARDEISVLVAEDNPDLRAAICALVAAEPGMRVAGEATLVAELIAAMRASAAQVLILDLDLGGESSVPALRRLRADCPRLGVVIYSGHDLAAVAQLLDQAGPCEYVMKSGEIAPLLEAVRRVAPG